MITALAADDPRDRRWRLDPAIDPSRLIAVVDLRHSLAVHAIAGRRSEYRPIEARRIGASSAGDAVALLDHYRSLGLHQFYVADLDAILDGKPQTDLYRRLIDHLRSGEGDTATATPRVWLDFGYRADQRGTPPLAELTNCQAAGGVSLGWIAGTETMRSPDCLARLADTSGIGDVVLSLDFRDGNFVSHRGDLTQWVRAAAVAVRDMIVLDVAQVGTGCCDRSLQRLCHVRSELAGSSQSRPGPQPRLHGGGGLRDAADVDAFVAAGAHGVLVATALLPR